MTEDDKITELMKPRYKVIADYPGCPYEVGTMVSPDEHGELYSKTFGYSKSGVMITMKMVDKFAHWVRPLQWWEDRAPEEWPEYYKYSGNHGVFKTSFRPSGGVAMLDFSPKETVPCKLEYCLPATHEEYLQYQQSTDHQ